MVALKFNVPRRWTQPELRAAAAAGVDAFIRLRLDEEPTRQYSALFARADARVKELFEATENLRVFTGEVFRADQKRVEVARYLCGPPVSADDLRTFVGNKLGAKQLTAALADEVAAKLARARDPVRFPWLQEGRTPPPSEVESAVRWTAGLMAVERMRTNRRRDARNRQERAVAISLTAANCQKVKRPAKGVRAPDDLAIGTFTPEVQLAGVKCDLLARLRDRRLLAIECKESNSAINSIKRLKHETGNKAAKWREAFGQQVVPVAVLAGVFDIANLEDAQNERGIFLVWEADLSALEEFVRDAT